MDGKKRYWFFLAVCATAAFLGGSIGGRLPARALAEGETTATLNRLNIVDEDGNPTITLIGRSGEGPGVFMTTKEQNVSVGLGIRDGRPNLVMEHSSGAVCFFGFDEKGPRVAFLDKGKLQATFGVFTEGPTPAVTLYDGNGVPRAMLAMGEEPHLTFADADGRPFRTAP
jgi:hypothetical protein